MSTIPGQAQHRSGPPRRSTRVAGWVIVILTLALGAEIALAATSPSPTRPQKPALVLRDSLAAAGASAGFHYRALWQANGLTQTVVGDARTTSGTQTVSVGTARFMAVLVDGMLYFRGDTAALRDQLGLSPTPSAADAGRWISLQPSDAPYQGIDEEGLTTETALSQVVIAPRAASPNHRTRGPLVVRITGLIPRDTDQVGTGTARLDVAARSKLPSTYLARGRNGGQPWSTSISFTRWGEDVPVTAPTGAVPYASLPGVVSPNR